MTDTQTIDERRDKGIAWLDGNYPGWRGKIDPELLNMAGPCLCIFGQLYGSYWDSPIVEGWNHAGDMDAYAMGFNVGGDVTADEVVAEFKRLTESWLRELAR